MNTQPHIIVFGNEKGGSGKSTTCMHVISGLLRQGVRVASLDLDMRQGTLTNFLMRRQYFIEQHPDADIPSPLHIPIPRSQIPYRDAAEEDELERLQTAINTLSANADVLVMDTPGSDTHLGRMGHSFADTVVTPINDSFVDLDVLARINPETHRIEGPSFYSEMIWDIRKLRAQRTGNINAIDWIVMRNRLSHLDARNKREMQEILEKLSQRIRFRHAPGFGERVIFRELFLKGLTLLDLQEDSDLASFSMSHVAARQEVRNLIDMIGINVPEQTPVPCRVSVAASLR